MRPRTFPAIRPLRRRILGLILLLLACCAVPIFVSSSQTGDSGHPAGILGYPQVTLSPEDRILVLAPHPDDEVLGTGGILQEAAAQGIPYRVVFLTNGDSNEWSFLLYSRRPEFLPRQLEAMGLIRQNEALAAGKMLGLSPQNEVFLGFPDFGTLHIWLSHWRNQPPYRSLLTRATQVPYANTLRPNAPHKGEAILDELESEILSFRPTKVFVSHPADLNVDHEALYLFVRVALWDLQAEIQPEVYPYLIHYSRWPAPRGPDATAVLAPPGRMASLGTWYVRPLTSIETDRKLQALQAHVTQYKANPAYLLSFIRSDELFGDLPEVTLGASQEQPLNPPGNAVPREGLSDEEQVRFVGVESRFIQLEGDKLVISLHLSRPLARGVGAAVYAFGYRRDRPFADMPKVRVQVGEFASNAYDQDAPLPRGSWSIERQPTQITVRLPLSTLGNPQELLAGARTYVGEVPLSTLPWRVLKFSGSQ